MQTEQVSNCPVCKGKSFKHFLTSRDFTYSQEEFNIQVCTECGLLATSPRPDQKSISDYYKSTQYISHINKPNNLIDFIYLKARSYTLRWKHKIITSKNNEIGHLLDYGCGTGEFLAHMSSKNWKVSGVEPADQAREKAKKLTNNSNAVITEDVKDLVGEKFDVITMWHVLEHVPQPGVLLTQLKSMLKSTGQLIIAVPNKESFDAEYYNQYWAGYDVPRHFWHFTKSTIQQLLSSQDLHVDEIIPMKLDAYYVSLLSEKYKNPKGRNIMSFIKAIKTGFLSNSKSKKTLNYSSLIYIARHA